ncbi:hypothetical protein RsTz2092_03300 [Deferribacterales bacterium RsTz2092]|nr:hypothetical protein AGMMS49941_09790 [Deferribacterales bacterium]
MDRNLALTRLAALLREVMDDESLIIDETSSVQQLEGWDSIAQVSIIAATETEFGLKIRLEELPSTYHVKGLLDIITARATK